MIPLGSCVSWPDGKLMNPPWRVRPFPSLLLVTTGRRQEKSTEDTGRSPGARLGVGDAEAGSGLTAAVGCAGPQATIRKAKATTARNLIDWFNTGRANRYFGVVVKRKAE